MKTHLRCETPVPDNAPYCWRCCDAPHSMQEDLEMEAHRAYRTYLNGTTVFKAQLKQLDDRSRVRRGW